MPIGSDEVLKVDGVLKSISEAVSLSHAFITHSLVYYALFHFLTTHVQF